MQHRETRIILLWSLCFWHLSEGWLAVAFRQSFQSPPMQESSHVDLDLFEALNISEAMRGVSQTMGSQPNSKAWKLHSAFDHAQVPEAASSLLLSKLKDQFHAEFVYRQHRKTVATLLSINSPGKMSPWLRVTSNTKLHKLFVYYRIKEDNKLHEKIFGLSHSQNWTHVGASFNGTKMIFYQDCQLPDKQQLSGHIFLKFPADSLIYFRQEPGFKKKLLGSIEVARVASFTPKHPSWHCPATRSSSNSRFLRPA